jgi:signal transduction histidine kinase
MSEAKPEIEWRAVRGFVRQLNHDLRNHLNAIELQIAFLNEIATDKEMKAELQRLRGMTTALATDLQGLSRSLKNTEPAPLRYPATEFIEDLRARLEREQPELASSVEWQVSLGEEALEIDPQLIPEVFLEIFANAALHGRAEGALIFEARSAEDAIQFRLREPKTKIDGVPENWGVRPFEQIRHGHYGLGLFRARGILEKQHGTLCARFDPATSQLVTSIVLPKA